MKLPYRRKWFAVLIGGLSAGASGGDIAIALAQKSASIKLVSTLSLSRYLKDTDAPNLGHFTILNRNEFVTVRPAYFKRKTTIDFWDVSSGKLKSRIVPPESIEPGSIQISPDTQYLIASQEVLGTFASSRVYDPHKLFIWNTRTKKLLRTIDFGPNIHIEETVFFPGTSNQIILAARTVYSPTGQNTSRIFRVHLDSGKFERNSGYPATRHLLHNFYGYADFSPDKKMVASVYEAGEGNAGSIEIVAVPSGQRLWYHHGDFKARPISGPTFFLSKSQLFFSTLSYLDTGGTPASSYINFIYDLKSRKVKPLPFRRLARLPCYSPIAFPVGYAFFRSKQGLELWNIARQKMLKRWPHLTQIRQITYSRDKKLIGFHYEIPLPPNADGEVSFKPNSATLQFWSIDPALPR